MPLCSDVRGDSGVLHMCPHDAKRRQPLRQLRVACVPTPGPGVAIGDTGLIGAGLNIFLVHRENFSKSY